MPMTPGERREQMGVHLRALTGEIEAAKAAQLRAEVPPP
jgi:hypothetical protein